MYHNPGEQAARARVTLRDSVISENGNLGLNLASTDAVIERSVIRDTRRAPDDHRFVGGMGIIADPWDKEKGPSNVVVRDSLITRNRYTNVFLRSARATMDRTVISQAVPVRLTSFEPGIGVGAAVHSELAKPTELALRDCLIEGNTFIGLGVQGSDVVVERCVIRNTRAEPRGGDFGLGISLYGGALSVAGGTLPPASLAITDSSVQSNKDTGIGSFYGRLKLVRTSVRDTRPRPRDGYNGAGLAVSGPVKGTRPALELIDSSCRAAPPWGSTSTRPRPW